MAQRLGTTVDHSGEGWATAFAAALTLALCVQDDDVFVVLTVEDARATLLAVSGLSIQSFLLGLLDGAPQRASGSGCPSNSRHSRKPYTSSPIRTTSSRRSAQSSTSSRSSEAGSKPSPTRAPHIVLNLS